MKIEYRLGDMFKAPERCLIHGCNSQGVMGSGVAKAVRELYPDAYSAYVVKHRTDGLRLGEVVWVECGERIIGNAITQDRYGRDLNTVYCSYDAIQTAMVEVQRYAAEHGLDRVGMPLIGSGLGNGDWTYIARIIEDAAVTFTPVVYIVERDIYLKMIS